MYSLKERMMASHTSGTNADIDCLEILKVYIRLVYESPLARNRRVAANLLAGEIESLKFEFLLEIWPPTLFKIISNSVGDIRIKFLNPIPSSIFKVSKSSHAY